MIIGTHAIVYADDADRARQAAELGRERRDHCGQLRGVHGPQPTTAQRRPCGASAPLLRVRGVFRG